MLCAGGGANFGGCAGPFLADKGMEVTSAGKNLCLMSSLSSVSIEIKSKIMLLQLVNTCVILSMAYKGKLCALVASIWKLLCLAAKVKARSRFGMIGNPS